MFDSHMPRRSPTMPLPKRLRNGERHWHGMKCVTLAVFRWAVGDLPRYRFFRFLHGHSRRLLLSILRVDDGQRLVAADNKISGQTAGLAVRIFRATMQTFKKDTALSERGRTCTNLRDTARHGTCHLAFNTYLRMTIIFTYSMEQSPS